MKRFLSCLLLPMGLGMVMFLAVPAAAGPVSGQDGRITVDLALDLSQSPVGKFIELPFTLTDAAGEPLLGAAVSVVGGMAMHGHGLPTSPVVEEIGGGKYVIRGLKFSMAGEWQLQLAIMAGSMKDTANFEFTL